MTTFLIIIGILLTIYGVIAFFVKMYRNSLIKRNDRGANDVVKLPLGMPAIIIGMVMFIFGICIVAVGPQEVGVLVTPSGVDDNEKHTGWHMVAPWNNVHMMDKTVWVYTCTDAKKEGAKDHSDAIWAPTKDGIKMGLDVSLSWRIDPDFASWIYQNVTENDGGNSGRYIWLEENVIRTKIKSALALTVSNYTPIEVYSSKREVIQTDVLRRIRDEVKKYHILIDNVDIREVYYNSAYEAAINNKKLAEQEALRLVDVTRQKNELFIQAKINKDIAIQQAMGEAEALRIKGNSVNANPKVIELNLIDKWNGQLPTTLINGSGGNGLILNIAK